MRFYLYLVIYYINRASLNYVNNQNETCSFLPVYIESNGLINGG